MSANRNALRIEGTFATESEYRRNRRNTLGEVIDQKTPADDLRVLRRDEDFGSSLQKADSLAAFLQRTCCATLTTADNYLDHTDCLSDPRYDRNERVTQGMWLAFDLLRDYLDLAQHPEKENLFTGNSHDVNAGGEHE